MYDLIECSDNYSEISGSLWQYNWHVPTLNDNGVIIDFPADNDSALFKFKQEITDETGNHGTKDIEIL